MAVAPCTSVYKSFRAQHARQHMPDRLCFCNNTHSTVTTSSTVCQKALLLLLFGNRHDTTSAKRLLAATNPPTPITHHSALTLSAGSEAWRSMRGCSRPPPLLVVLEGVVPLLVLPLQRPGMCPAVLIGSTGPTGASRSMGATRPDMGTGPSKVP